MGGTKFEGRSHIAQTFSTILDFNGFLGGFAEKEGHLLLTIDGLESWRPQQRTKPQDFLSW